MQRELKVHMLVDSLSAGGAELLLAEFASVAPAEGIRMSVAHLYSREDEGPAAERFRALGVEPYAVPIGDRLAPRAFRRVRRHLAGLEFDLLHTHLGNSDLLGGVGARTLRKPAVSTIHSMDWSGPLKSRVKQRVFALARRHCHDRVIAVSDSSRENYLAHGWDTPERVVVVRNGLERSPEPGTGGALRAELGIAEDAFVAAMVSTFRPEKAHDVAIEAAAMLRERFPAFRLLVVGYGQPWQEREVRAAAAGLDDCVLFAGHRGDVMRVLDASDALLQPSRADAYPTAILEAMAAGVPVVASSVGGIPEMVEEGRTALLIDAPPSPAALADAIARLVESPNLCAQLATAAKEDFARRHTAARWAAATRAVYDDVLARR